MKDILFTFALVFAWMLSGFLVGCIGLVIKSCFKSRGKRIKFIKEVFALTANDWFEGCAKLGPLSAIFILIQVMMSYDPQRRYQSMKIDEWLSNGLKINHYYYRGKDRIDQQEAQNSLAELDRSLEQIPIRTRRLAWITAMITTLVLNPFRSSLVMAKDEVKLFFLGDGGGNNTTLKVYHESPKIAWELTAPGFPGRKLKLQAGPRLGFAGFSTTILTGLGIVTDDASGAKVNSIVTTFLISRDLPLGFNFFTAQELTTPLRKNSKWSHFTDNTLTFFKRKYFNLQAQMCGVLNQGKSFAWCWGPRVSYDFGENRNLSIGWLKCGQKTPENTLDLKLIFGL